MRVAQQPPVRAARTAGMHGGRTERPNVAEPGVRNAEELNMTAR